MAKLALAGCLAGSEKLREALPLAQAVTQATPGSRDAHRTLAAIYAGLHNERDAAHERKIAESIQDDPGPKLHSTAPDFQLVSASGSRKFSLRDFRGKTPVVLVFGSYSCPNFRGSAVALKAMQERFGARIPFYSCIFARRTQRISGGAHATNARTSKSLPPGTLRKGESMPCSAPAACIFLFPP
jgi:hypothetical protein